MSELAYIGLGANLGDRASTLARALGALDSTDGIAVRDVSMLYSTPPFQVDEPQPEFLNAVACIRTAHTPQTLVHELLRIERDLGRHRRDERRWAARIIDLDLLLFGARSVDEEGCRVPHPRLHEREFALRPLVEIAPDIEIPGRGSAAAALARLGTATAISQDGEPA